MVPGRPAPEMVLIGSEKISMTVKATILGLVTRLDSEKETLSLITPIEALIVLEDLDVTILVPIQVIKTGLE